MQVRLELRDLLERGPQHLQVARVPAGLGQSPHGALHVADGLERFADVAEEKGLGEEVGDHLLSRAKGAKGAKGMQDPVAQFARAHRRHRAVERAEQRGVAPAAARLHEFEVRLRRRVEHHELRVLINRQPRDVAQRAPQLRFQIMQDRTRRADGRGHGVAAEAVERLHFEMLTQSEVRLLVEKGVAVARDHAAELAELPGLLLGDEHLGGLDAGEFIGERGVVGQFGDAEIAGREIDEGEPEPAFRPGVDRGEEVVPFRIEQVQVRDRAGADDVRDFALHDLPFHRLADLIADGHAPPRLEQSSDVILRRVMRDAAHRHEVPFGQRHVENGRRLLRVLEKHLVEIPQPKQQQRIRRQRPADALVLLHHRGQGLGHGRRLEAARRTFKRHASRRWIGS